MAPVSAIDRQGVAATLTVSSGSLGTGDAPQVIVYSHVAGFRRLDGSPAPTRRERRLAASLARRRR